MLTIRPEIKKEERRKDGSYNIKIRLTLNRKIKRISTSLFAKSSDLTKNLEIKKGTALQKNVDKLIVSYQEKCDAMLVDINGYSLAEIVQRLQYVPLKPEDIDFIAFSKNWIASAKIKGKINYQSTLNSFMSFLHRDTLNMRQLDSNLLKSYLKYLENRREKRIKKLIEEGKRVTSNRIISFHMGNLRHLYKEAQKEYNSYEYGTIVLPYSPFDIVHVPKQELTRKRALTKEQILSIWHLAYKGQKNSRFRFSKFDLAKDCFILSFCLIGMNSVDLYNLLPTEGRIIYERAKTRDRRLDRARMEVDIPDLIRPLLEKYKDSIGERLFCFHSLYASRRNFNIALNRGLKEIGEALGIEDLEFYAARHSWATIALNKVRIDKYTVHSALNHVDESMRVTDIYIQKDYVIENEANEKVIDYVFGQETLVKKKENLSVEISTCLLIYGVCTFAANKKRAG